MSYVVAHTLPELLDVLEDGAATILAGGTDLFARTEQDLNAETIVDLTRIDDLQGIAHQGDVIRIGAAATWSDLMRQDMPCAFDGLKAAAREVGSVQIQNTGTLVGNICNASPAADGIPALLTLGAEVEIQSRGVLRRVPLSEFITAPGKVDLRPGEVVTALCTPVPDTTLKSAFEKLGSRRYLVISIAMVAVLVGLDTRGCFSTVRIAVGACGPVAQRLPALERAMIGQDPAMITIRPEECWDLTPITDMRATAIYRQTAAAELVQRALRKGAGL